MTLPKILIVDDQIPVNADQRGDFCSKCELLDVKAVSFARKPDHPKDYLAEAHFCSGQKEGRNDYKMIEEAVRAGFRNDDSSGWSLVLLDVQFWPDEGFGLEVRRRLLDSFPGLKIVMLTGLSQSDIKDDQIPYLSKHKINSRDLIIKLLKHGSLKDKQINKLLQLEQHHIKAKSPKMINIFLQAFIFAKTDTSILILGETGTGKEVIANYIHALSVRSSAPFVGVNISAISKELMTSELFGIEKNIATGVAERIGIFKRADTGTLFLDEIGDMPLDTQQMLLRALEERKIVRVGGIKEIPVNIRLLSATSKNLDRLVEEGRFREDVQYRINSGVIKIPPLRERIEDIVPLAKYFLKGFQEKADKDGISFSKDALEPLKEYSFSGNVRELRSIVERVASNKGNREIITKDAVSQEINNRKSTIHLQSPPAPLPPSPSVVKNLTDLEDLLQNIQVPTAPVELWGRLASLQHAYGQLIKRLLETALQQTKITHDDDYVLPAVRLLLGKERKDYKKTYQAYDKLNSLADLFPCDALDPALKEALERAKKRSNKKENGDLVKP